jgi:hypothetical protein
MTETAKKPIDPFTTAVLGYLVPGAGHFALGRRAKAVLYFVLIVGVFFAGWLISGRENVYLDRGRWHFLVQMGTGAATWVVGLLSEAPEPELTVLHYFEIGTLYTMVAGLLNVLVVTDAVMTSLRLRGRAR